MAEILDDGAVPCVSAALVPAIAWSLHVAGAALRAHPRYRSGQAYIQGAGQKVQVRSSLKGAAGLQLQLDSM